MPLSWQERRVRPRVMRAARSFVLVGLVVSAAACGDSGTTPPGELRFGQIGSVDVELSVPLRLGIGTLEQSLHWDSNGAWSLSESISYRGLVGDSAMQRSGGDPGRYAQAFALLITQVNEAAALKLFDVVEQDGHPTCATTETRVVFHITDDTTEREARWIACAPGSLANLTPTGAGPTPEYSRVVQATILARDGTLGQGFRSVYAGSVPFGTLDRGDDTPSNVRQPIAITAKGSWQEFWADHAPGRTIPEVNFATEMVVVGVTGVQREAGDSVEVRRILQVDQGTLTHVVERVPGDFCSPASRTHIPFHIVVAPRTPDPLRFADIFREEVPCG